MRDALGCAKLSWSRRGQKMPSVWWCKASPWLCRFAGSPIFSNLVFKSGAALRARGGLSHKPPRRGTRSGRRMFFRRFASQ
jgi:hypothetical protein